MYQMNFTDLEFASRKKKTHREETLELLDQVIPWDEWIDLIQPYYPSGKHGRPVRGIETMLRMYILQILFHLSDRGVEDIIYDSYAMRAFMHLDFNKEQVPDSTTLLKFRHLLEENNIGKKFFDNIVDRLNKNGMIMHGGTIIDATIINAPSSTKNREGKRDPEMHQTKKGNQWYHGAKAHIGVDAGSGFVHTVTATAANVPDISEAHKLIRDDDEVVHGDSGYAGISKREEIKSNDHLSQIDYRICSRKDQMKKETKVYTGVGSGRYIEYRKASIRSKVEHAFLILKCHLKYSKVSYRGIAKNLNRLYVSFGLVDILMCIRAGAKTIERFCMG